MLGHDPMMSPASKYFLASKTVSKLRSFYFDTSLHSDDKRCPASSKQNSL